MANLEQIIAKAIDDALMTPGEQKIALPILKQEYHPIEAHAEKMFEYAKTNKITGFLAIKRAYDMRGNVAPSYANPNRNEAEGGIVSSTDNTPLSQIYPVNVYENNYASGRDIYTESPQNSEQIWANAIEKDEPKEILQLVQIENDMPKSSSDITYPSFEERSFVGVEEGKLLLESALEYLKRGETDTTVGCVKLFLAWEQRNEDDSEIYEFMNEVGVYLPEMNRKWVLQKFHIGETVVQIGRKFGVEENWFLKSKRLHNTHRWSFIYSCLPKRTIPRKQRVAGRPLELLGDIPGDLLEILKRAVEAEREEDIQELLLPSEESTKSRKVEFSIDRGFIKELSLGKFDIPENPEARTKYANRLGKQLKQMELAIEKARRVHGDLMRAEMTGS